jgi:outer membrane protein TolC
MKKHLVILLSVPLVMAGCINRDVAVKLDVAVPAAFDNASLATGADVDDAAWWASFGDSQLSALVNTALRNNRSLKAAEAGVRTPAPCGGARLRTCCRRSALVRRP